MSDSGRGVVAVVAGSHFVNHAYLLLLPPVIGTLATAFDVGVAAIALGIGLANGVVVVLQLPFGYLSDAYSRTLVLGISLVFGALGAALTAVAQSYEWLLVAQVVLGIGVAGHHPAHYPLLAAASDDGERGRAYSAHAFGGAVGLAAPYAITAAVTGLGYGWRVAVGVVAVVGAGYAVCALTYMRGVDDAITKPALDDDPAGESGLTDPAGESGLTDPAALGRRAVDGVRQLLSAPGILALTALAFLTSAAAWCIRTYTPRLLSAGYGLADGTANLLVSAMLVVGSGTILAGGALTDRVGATRVMVGGYVALTVIAGALATGSLPLALLVVVLVFSGSISVSRPARSALADTLSARRDLGKNFALVTVGISLGGTVAPPAFGWLIERTPVATAFAVVAVVGLLSLVLTAWIADYSTSHPPAGVVGGD